MPQENSTTVYIKNWLQLIREAGTEDPAKILQHILNKPVKITTKANLLNAIISLVRMKPDLIKDISPFEKERDKLQSEIRNKVGKDNQNERQRAISDKVTWKDIEDLTDRLRETKDNSIKDLEDFILLRLMNPPLRNDLEDIKICQNKKDLTRDNCIFIDRAKKVGLIRINNHKTTSRGGKPILINLDEELTEDIIKLLSDGRTHLFVNRFRQPFKQSTFTHRIEGLFNKHLGHKIGSTMLRKLYHTANTKEDMEELRAIKDKIDKTAEKMGHSSSVIQSHYIDWQDDK